MRSMKDAPKQILGCLRVYADGKNQDGVGAINAEKDVCLGKF